MNTQKSKLVKSHDFNSISVVIPAVFCMVKKYTPQYIVIAITCKAYKPNFTCDVQLNRTL